MEYDDASSAQAAAQALRGTQGMRATDGGMAEDAGLQARTGASGAMNEGRNYSGGIGNAPGDVQAKEMQANSVVRTARRAIIETGGMSMEDLLDLGVADGGDAGRSAMDMKRKMHNEQQFTTQHPSNLMEQPQHQQQYQPQPQYQQQGAEGWQVVQKRAKLKSGKVIPVFMVEDELSGMSTGKKYRIMEVAEKIARVLNATQNPNDPRVQMIEAAYDEHVTIMRNLNKAKRAGNYNKVSMLESQLQAVNNKLGLG